MTQDQEEKLNDIHRALVGDKDLGIKGLIPRVEENEKKLNAHLSRYRAKRNQERGAIAVFGLAWAALVWVANKFWN